MQRNLKNWRKETPATHRSFSEKRNRKDKYEFLYSEEEQDIENSTVKKGQ